MVRKVTKYAVRVTDPTRVLYELEKAYCFATCGRPGSCWTEIPLDIQSSLVEQDEFLLLSAKEKERLMRPPAVVNHESLLASVAAVANGLREAKRPLLWLGIGIRLARATSKLPAFLDQLRKHHPARVHPALLPLRTLPPSTFSPQAISNRSRSQYYVFRWHLIAYANFT